jgi:hypothetical protein
VSNGFSEFLLSLDDEEFFAVMRNYLGPLSTPFNKHDLIRRLQRFLTRVETVRRIRAYIDSWDREILAAVHYFREPRERDLHFFFGESHGYLNLHSRLLNLQDRLILLANRTTHRIRINPLLADHLSDLVTASALVPSRAASPQPPREGWFQISLLPALMAFLREFPEPLKSGGGVRKRAEEALRERFPLLYLGDDGEESVPPRLRYLLKAAGGLGILDEEGGRLSVSEGGLRRLSDLPDEWARLLAVAAETGSRESRELYTLAGALQELLEGLDPERSYEQLRLGRYLGIILRGQGGEMGEGEELLSTLIRAGLLQRDDDGYLRLARELLERQTASGREDEESGNARSAGGTLLSPNFEITLPADAPLQRHLLAAKLARILRYDRFCRYEITRDSFLDGCDGRREGEEQIRELMELTGRLPQNIATSLEAWVAEYGAFRLLEGVVLLAEGQQATLLEHAPAIQPYLRKKLAEGVYLMQGPEGEWRRALAEIGFEQVPPVERQRSGRGLGPYPFEPPATERDRLAYTAGTGLSAPGLSSGGGSDPGISSPGVEVSGPAAEDASGEARHAIGASDLRDSLGEEIEKMKTGEEVKQELARRLEMKLLLYPEQLENEAARRAVAEARGLDYLGKIRIIEAALSASGDLLEVLTRKPGADPERMLLRPRSLEKGSSDVILHGTALPENRPVKVQVRKIALLRKLTGTLIRSL